MAKTKLIERILYAIASVSRNMLSNETAVRLYELLFKKDFLQKEPPGLIEALIGTILVIGTIITAIVAIITGYSAIYGLLHHEIDDDGLDEFNKALSCVKSTCNPQDCLDLFSKKFPASPRVKTLQVEANKVVAYCNQLSPPPDPPPELGPMPPLPSTSGWQALASAIAAAQSQTPATDKAVRDAYQQVQSVASGIQSSQQREMLQQAQAALRRLAKSDGDLKALHDAAGAWRGRKGFELPNFEQAKLQISPYDESRLDEEGWYRDDWNTLEAAEQLTQWPNRGFTAKTKAVIPVYMEAGNPNDIDGKIASLLKEALKDKLNFTDEKHAALFMEIKNARSYSESPRHASSQTRGRTVFDVAIRWIGGAPLPSIHADKDTDNISGADGDREETVRKNSLNYAIQQACEAIKAL